MATMTRSARAVRSPFQDAIVRQGALAGLLAALPLMALLYLGTNLQVVAFVPLDMADFLIRITPGAVATAGIERLGHLAKELITLSGILGFLVMGAVWGGVIAYLGRRLAWRSLVIPGALLSLIPMVVSIAIGHAGMMLPAGLLSLVLDILFFMGGGALTGFLTERLAGAIPQAGMTASAAAVNASRRAFLARTLPSVLVGSGALALAGYGIGKQQMETMNQPVSLPTPVGSIASPQAAAMANTAVPVATLAATAPATAAAMAATPAATATAIPAPTATPTLAVDASFQSAPGTRPELTSTNDFYVVSINTQDPMLDSKAWWLRIEGAVDKPITLSYQDILNMPRVDQYGTQECVSNDIDGAQISTTLWNGTRLRDILRMVGVQPGVVKLKLEAADGYSDGLPIEKAMEETTLLVYGMNGQVLPARHGFPMKLVVGNLYGEKQPKWLTKITAVKENYLGYWMQRGWGDAGIVQTTSVIDLPSQMLKPNVRGIIPIGGVAFAGARSIQSVEVKIDQGDWTPVTQLNRELNARTWRLWRYDWKGAASGAHTISVRCVDGTGARQPETLRPPHPDGATGLHTVNVTVA